MTDVRDRLAGIVDLFGAVTRPELERALSELAYRRDGADADAQALGEAVESAVAEYYLVEAEPGVVEPAPADPDDGALLTVGPVAFPTLPRDAEDLPHIMDLDRRSVDRVALGERVAERLAADASRTIDAGDGKRIADLLDVSYDLEAWAPVDAGETRARLDEALQDKAEEGQ